jgi:drug/metabolite transporter (DMT)-like permease
MEIWVLITIAAAFLQNIRSVLQKHLKGVMGTTGATFVRFGFGLPFAIAFVALLALVLDNPLPDLTPRFGFWVTLGAVAQIAGQATLIQMFGHRNFTVGTAYSRTEPAQAALFGLVFLGDRLGPGTLIAIAISLVGVVLISVARSVTRASALIRAVLSRTAALGLASGAAFGLAAVSYRAASLSLDGPGFMMQAAVTLLAAIFLQTCAMLIWMRLRAPDELGRIRKAWKVSALVGMVGATASFGWFMAMTLQTAAAVKALAQIEMIFTFASSVLIFRENVNKLEICGCILIVTGILVLLLV